MLLVDWLVEEMGLEQCKAEPSVFLLVVKDEVLLIIGVYVDSIKISGSKNACEKFFAQMKERFPFKSQGNQRCKPVVLSFATGNQAC